MERRNQRLQYVVGLSAVALAVVLAVLELWPFDEPRNPAPDASLWEVVLYHGPVLGLLRLTMVVVALYGIASVPVLVVTGRWAKGVGTGGLIADDARVDVASTALESRRRLTALQEENARVVEERDELLKLVDAETAPE